MKKRSRAFCPVSQSDLLAVQPSRNLKENVISDINNFHPKFISLNTSVDIKVSRLIRNVIVSFVNRFQ